MFYDKKLINIWKCILLQFLWLPDGKNIHQHKKCIFPEGKTFTSTTNIYQRVMQFTRWVQPLRTRKIFWISSLSYTNIMVDIWLFDEKSIGSYNTKNIWCCGFYFEASTNIYIIFHTKLKNIDGKITLLVIKQ